MLTSGFVREPDAQRHAVQHRASVRGRARKAAAEGGRRPALERHELRRAASTEPDLCQWSAAGLPRRHGMNTPAAAALCAGEQRRGFRDCDAHGWGTPGRPASSCSRSSAGCAGFPGVGRSGDAQRERYRWLRRLTDRWIGILRRAMILFPEQPACSALREAAQAAPHRGQSSGVHGRWRADLAQRRRNVRGTRPAARLRARAADARHRLERPSGRPSLPTETMMMDRLGLDLRE